MTTVEHSQFEALVSRIEVLEAKAGIGAANSGPTRYLPDDRSLESSVELMTETVFGKKASIEQQHGEAGEHDFLLVSVPMDPDADPREMATRTSRWYANLNEMNTQGTLFRLKVVFE